MRSIWVKYVFVPFRTANVRERIVSRETGFAIKLLLRKTTSGCMLIQVKNLFWNVLQTEIQHSLRLDRIMRLVCLFTLAFAGPVGAQNAPDPSSIKAGHELYSVFCETCHGPEARGDGPFADILMTPPADLTRLSADNGGSFPTLRATRQIDGRDPLPGHGGEMPVFGPIFDTDFAAMSTSSGQPILTSQSITDLIHWLESIQETG